MQCEALAKALDAGDPLTHEAWEALACAELTMGAVVETRTRKLFVPTTKREPVLVRVQFDVCARDPGVVTRSPRMIHPAGVQLDVSGRNAVAGAADVPNDENTQAPRQPRMIPAAGADFDVSGRNAAMVASEVYNDEITPQHHIQANITTASTARAASVALYFVPPRPR